SVFPHTQLWISPDRLGYYLIGAPTPLVMRHERVQAVAVLPGVAADLKEFDPPVTWNEDTLRPLFLMDGAAIDRYVADEWRWLTDDRPYTEFPWLRWLTYGREHYKHWMKPECILPYARPPTSDIFSASGPE